MKDRIEFAFNEVIELITVASNGYIGIDCEIQKLIKKLSMLINYVLSIYNLNEEKQQQYEKLNSLLIKIIY